MNSVSRSRSALIPYRTVEVSDVLCFLMARTATPSTMGAQLDAARAASVVTEGKSSKESKRTRKAKVAERKGFCQVCLEDIEAGCAVVERVHLRCYGESFTHEGMHVKATEGDGVASREQAELRIPSDLPVIRCLDGLAAERNCNRTRNYQTLSKLHRTIVAKNPERTQGELVIQCLRQYEQFKLRSPHQALAAVYEWAQSHAPESYPKASLDVDSEVESGSQGNGLAQAFLAGSAKEERAKAAELYADCLMVLGDWVKNWNKQKVKLVS